MNPRSISCTSLSKALLARFLFVAFNLDAVFAFDCPGSKTPPLVVKGKRYYDSSNDEYVPIKGIAYYPRPNAGDLSESNSVDFYTDEFSDRWTVDIANMKELGVNAVRLYAVDPSANHDAFMCTLQQAGIYVMLGLLADCEDCGIGAWVGKDAEPPLCYTSTLKERGRFVIRSFSKYDNVMAFSAGNEVSIYADDGEGGPREANVPCQKKFIRDMREYVSKCSGGGANPVLPRAVPIGVVNWDGQNEQNTYYHCRTDPNDVFENAEWFAINSYRHCDGAASSKDEIIGWPELLADFRNANFPGPVMFGEYGCREQGFPTIDGFETQRTWYQAEALYSPVYSDVFAGGFVFEYSAEKDVIDSNLQWWADRRGGEPDSVWPYQKFAKLNYGIGYFGPSDCEHDNGTPCEYIKYPEYEGLARVLAMSDGQSIRGQSPGSIPACPDRFQPLSFYSWPTDEEDDPELEYCLATRSPTTAPWKDDAPEATDAPTISPSESLTTMPTLSPTLPPSRTTPDPTILTNQDITTISPSVTNSLLPTFAPTAASTNVPTYSKTNPPTNTPSNAPTKTPTKSPTKPPTNSPTNELTNSSTNSPTNASTNTPTNAITNAPTKNITPSPTITLSPTAEWEIETALCSFHPKCAAADLGGSCCPTLDGIVLGCCEVKDEVDEADTSTPNGLESSARGFVLYQFHLIVSGLAIMLVSW